MGTHQLQAILAVAASVILLDPASAVAAAGGGGGGNSGGGRSVGRAARSPEKDAERSYQRGLRERDSAWKHERKAAKAPSDRKRQQEIESANKDWKQAIEHYQKAIEKAPRYAEVHSSLGYALRKLGDYDTSLASYNRALELKPGLPEALEYRAEAYLAMGRLHDATRSFSKLERSDRGKAEQLLAAMELWLTKVSDAPDAELTVTQRSPEWLREWVSARKSALEQRPIEESEISETAADEPARPAW